VKGRDTVRNCVSVLSPGAEWYTSNRHRRPPASRADRSTGTNAERGCPGSRIHRPRGSLSGPPAVVTCGFTVATRSSREPRAGGEQLRGDAAQLVMKPEALLPASSRTGNSRR
jgi:hypothetical protein